MVVYFTTHTHTHPLAKHAQKTHTYRMASQTSQPTDRPTAHLHAPNEEKQREENKMRPTYSNAFYALLSLAIAVCSCHNFFVFGVCVCVPLLSSHSVNVDSK